MSKTAACLAQQESGARRQVGLDLEQELGREQCKGGGLSGWRRVDDAFQEFCDGGAEMGGFWGKFA